MRTSEKGKKDVKDKNIVEYVNNLFQFAVQEHCTYD